VRRAGHRARTAGIAFTEHYSYAASEPIELLRERYRDEILVLRGVEFSAAEGHCLVFGVDTDRLDLAHAPVETLIRAVEREGGVVIPSHPYRGGSGMGDMVHALQASPPSKGTTAATTRRSTGVRSTPPAAGGFPSPAARTPTRRGSRLPASPSSTAA